MHDNYKEAHLCEREAEYYHVRYLYCRLGNNMAAVCRNMKFMTYFLTYGSPERTMTLLLLLCSESDLNGFLSCVFDLRSGENICC